MAVSAMRTPAFVEAERSRIERGLGGFGISPADRDRPPIAISVAEPEAYVPIALFLASPASNHLTGDIISPEVWLSTEPDRVDHEGHNRVNSDSVRGRLDRTAL